MKEAFDTNWVVPMGPNVNAFEKNLEAFVNSKSDGSGPLTVMWFVCRPVLLLFIWH